MPELIFKGKEFVYNHHLSVPFRPLVPHAKKSIGGTHLDGNLIIHGDNLHALKALLPMYAGKVDCVFIDPPYNTGNEGWAYNDNVNSPIMKEWLKANPIGLDDGLRHDKWLAMMYPRVKLLHELMSEQGSLWMTLDDNESHRARLMLDEIFGESGFVANIAWVKRYTRSNNAKMFYSLKDTLLVYRKTIALDTVKEPRTEKSDSNYTNPDNDPRGPWMTSSYVNPATREQRKRLVYPIKNPFTGKMVEHPTHAWKYKLDENRRHIEENRLWWGEKGDAEYPRLKLFLDEAEQLVPIDVWSYEDVGSSDDGGDELKRIFGKAVFENPKPTRLISKVLSLVPNRDALVLDSFAGSGTTAHAVLAANKSDDGNRKFILVEGEEYADKITAERVRRVIKGYEFSGTQREELLRENITFSKLKNPNDLLDRIAGIENLDAHRFDNISKTVKNGELLVVGEKAVKERAEGLGGSFTYCSLGDAVELDKILTGKTLPSFETLAALLFHTATNEAFDPKAMVVEGNEGYLGESSAYHIWLIYRPDIEFLKSRDAALTLTKAEAIAASRPDKQNLVFAPAKFVSQKLLNDRSLNVEHAPLPFSLYRLERS
ncbi:site-specific DNA-methyltransferase [Parvibaculum sedimenti]|uniref:site-specific DNA-methyltransferase (adenine-specific) n=1 Tax=Parvibaculum sedimenti TaxID=2608632 RepID=A0A6N6VH01_9HYPH|nr:site-specific DNA-methyltransferase [Parvibaculum sedimenti]KAB7739988.1 site-specific DNA-methyltransferase [Parvibaculum sedimenti]